MIWLRQLISSNVLLYKIWFYSVRKYRGDYVRLPVINDDFYFDGYPRSGNTFFKGLIKKSYPNKKFAHHLHSIAGLKIALKAEIPIFIIIREPKDAVNSYLFRKVITTHSDPNERLIEKLLISYNNYYEFVKEHIKHINIFKFESAIDNEFLLPKVIAETVGFEKRTDDFLQEKLKKYKVLMKKKEKQKDSYASSLPNEERAKFKAVYQNKVVSSSTYKATSNLYKELSEFDLLSQKTNKNHINSMNRAYESTSN